MKKIMFIMILASMFLMSCEAKKNDDLDIEENESTVVSEVAGENEDVKVDEETKSETTMTEETDSEPEKKIFVMDKEIKFEKDNVEGKIKYLELNEDGATLHIDISNKTSKKIAVRTAYESINSYMVYGESELNLEPKETSLMKVFFSKQELDNSNITEIKKIEFKFIVSDPDTEDEMFRINNVVLDISKDGLEEIAYEKKDIVLDQNGLKLIKIKDEKLSSGEYKLRLLAINNTGKDIFVSDVDAYVNDIKETANFKANILSGKKAFIPIKFEDMTLKKYGANNLETVKLQISVFTEDLLTELFISPLFFIKY
ncbi:MAG: hypothetical protein CSB16_00510 [Clostridiales bacterium]|nr:MAG: hypothetical protein CSB16_00510 [Clostridiales bacterium]